MPDGFVPIFTPAGTGHRAGAVPDPGTNPPDYVLRADATWGAQAGSTGHIQHQVVSLAIATGQAEATGPAPFSPAFGGTPDVFTTPHDISLLTSVTGASPGGCIVVMQAPVATIVGTTADVSVLAVFQ